MNQPIETHYDSLKVMRTAPVEVIKASYRVLSQKYHPDRNPDPDALRIMKLINQAWDVLSDPERRATHDRWIAKHEQATPPASAGGWTGSPAAAAAAAAFRPAPHAAPSRGGASAFQHSSDGASDSIFFLLFGVRGRGLAAWLGKHAIRLVAGVAIALAVLFGCAQLIKAHESRNATPPVSYQGVSVAAPADPETSIGVLLLPPLTPEEAMTAGRLPHGYHGYIRHEPQYATGGLSSVEIDNTLEDKDAEVRLYRNGRVVRSMFVHQGKRFEVAKLAPGSYVMKYKIVVNGTMHAYQANEVFQLNQAVEETDTGTYDRFSKLVVTMSSPAAEISLDQF